jgi:hypothetical protein
MYRRKVILTAAAVFGIAVAFAAQPSLRADWGEGVPHPGSTWVPGTNALMSAQEENISILAPPR